jgi:YHS domain-containing protein
VLIRTLLIVLLVLLLIRFVWRLLSGIVDGASGDGRGRRGSPSSPAVRMVQDPVCGTYVVPGKALEMSRGRETLFFCSEKCRNQYLEGRR